MKLGLRERLVAKGLLPQQGDMLTLMVAKRAGEALTVTAEEMAKWHITDVRDGQGQIVGAKWDEEANEPYEVDLEPAAVDLIKKALKTHDEKKTLTMEMVSTYEMFVGT